MPHGRQSRLVPIGVYAVLEGNDLIRILIPFLLGISGGCTISCLSRFNQSCRDQQMFFNQVTKLGSGIISGMCLAGQFCS
jgi:hypothetical protein